MNQGDHPLPGLTLASTAASVAAMETLRIDVGGRHISATLRGATLRGGGPRGATLRAAGRPGADGPLVVFESGFGIESGSWEPVVEGLPSQIRSFAYDRAGRGASDPAKGPRSPAEVLGDLHSLLGCRELAPARPLILVGHSFGGLVARLYASRYPGEVAGLVLVDSLHEDQFELMGPAFPGPRAGEPPTLAGMRSFWQGLWRDPANNREGIDLPAFREEAHRLDSLGNLPIMILTAASYTYRAEKFFPGGIGLRLQDLWVGLQKSLGRLSSDAEWRLVEDSSHFLHVDRPEAVIVAIKDLVGRLGPEGPRPVKVQAKR